jgi:hypothetical protein
MVDGMRSPGTKFHRITDHHLLVQAGHELESAVQIGAPGSP